MKIRLCSLLHKFTEASKTLKVKFPSLQCIDVNDWGEFNVNSTSSACWLELQHIGLSRKKTWTSLELMPYMKNNNTDEEKLSSVIAYGKYFGFVEPTLFEVFL